MLLDADWSDVSLYHHMVHFVFFDMRYLVRGGVCFSAINIFYLSNALETSFDYIGIHQVSINIEAIK